MDSTKYIDNFFEDVINDLKKSKFKPIYKEEGIVSDIGDGIIDIENLSDVGFYELLYLPKGVYALTLKIEKKRVQAVVLGDYKNIEVGDEVLKTSKAVSVPVGYELLGRVIDPLGEPLDEKGKIQTDKFYPIEAEAVPMVRRDFVKNPLYTGIKIIDSMIPIGRGQRELIIGDSSLGKTSIAIDTIINQKDQDIFCIYVSIGQKKSQIAKVIGELKRNNALDYTIVVAASADDAPGLKFIAPYAGCAIAEYFRDQGKDALIIYDDLTKHADAYRMLSLLLEIPPGREAYPGDIFYIHSKLLERAGRRSDRYGGGSITALPIIETQSGRISAYIPTNLISITDGQIYLDRELFNMGFLPAIDIGKSVSRIGGKTQVDAMKKVAAKLKLDYSQFLEVEVFTKFGAKLEEKTQKLLIRGEALREILKQQRFEHFDMPHQVVIFMLHNEGYLEKISLKKVRNYVDEVLKNIDINYPEIFINIKEKKDIDESIISKIKEIAEKILENYKGNFNND
nr:F0F1 ATP synthase subunit alpha [Nitrosophilus kaiyonis]